MHIQCQSDALALPLFSLFFSVRCVCVCVCVCVCLSVCVCVCCVCVCARRTRINVSWLWHLMMWSLSVWWCDIWWCDRIWWCHHYDIWRCRRFLFDDVISLCLMTWSLCVKRIIASWLWHLMMYLSVLMMCLSVLMMWCDLSVLKIKNKRIKVSWLSDVAV